MRSPRHFSEAGFHVLCEKPMTMTVEEGEDIVRTAKASGKVCAVNYAYSAYPMIRHMRHMVDAGDLGAVRTVVKPISAMATTRQAMMPTIRGCAGAMIRRRPACRAMADCGIHALHLASFILGDEVEKLSADFASTVSGRVLEDDAMVNFRTAKGTVGRLWTSTIALGRQHGLDAQTLWRKRRACAGPQNSPTSLLEPAGRPHRDYRKRRGKHLRYGRTPQPRADCHARRFPAGVCQHLQGSRRCHSAQRSKAGRWTPWPTTSPKRRMACARWQLSTPDARAMTEASRGRLIEKTRHILTIDGFVWEVDAYEGTLAGLVTAEVEMGSEADTPSLPSWLGREVTGDPAWSNAMLAMNGRPGDGSP
jgi:hypothetical protein